MGQNGDTAVAMVEHGVHEAMLFALGLVLFGVFLLLLFSDRLRR